MCGGGESKACCVWHLQKSLLSGLSFLTHNSLFTMPSPIIVSLRRKTVHSFSLAVSMNVVPCQFVPHSRQKRACALSLKGSTLPFRAFPLHSPQSLYKVKALLSGWFTGWRLLWPGFSKRKERMLFERCLDLQSAVFTHR